MKIVALTLSIIIMIISSSCQEEKKSFKIPAEHVGMFGYGSLMSKKFIESGLLEKNYDGPFLSTHLRGYKRSWTFAWHQSIPQVAADGSYYKDYILVDGDTTIPEYVHYLNIREEKESVINGVLYIVPEADLPTYDGWELGYERFDVTDLITDYEIEGGKVFAYRALPEFTIEPNSDYKRNIIELSYSKIIGDAFGYWGKEFEAEYMKSTVPVDSKIIKESLRSTWVNPPLDTLEKLRNIFKYK